MADYGIFRSGDAKRIAAATRRVEGTPRQYVHVPEQISRRYGGGGGNVDITGTLVGPFTIAEYDAVSGEVLHTLYRGRSRTNSSLFDSGLLFSSDGYLYAGGTGDINSDTGCILKWDVTAYENVWRSADNGGNATVFGSASVGAGTNRWKNFQEASDGFIWACAGPDGTSYVTRTDPDTGVQTHSYGTTAAMQIFKADNSGGVVIQNGNASPYLRVLDNTASSTATHTTVTVTVNESNGVLCCTGSSSALRLLSASNLTTIDSLAAPSGQWFGAVSDGTHVYAAYTSNYTKLDATNLAAAAIWTNTKSTTNSLNMFEHSGRVYDVHYNTVTPTNGGIAKINTSSGAVTWDYTTSGRVLHAPACVAFGSDFVVIATVGTGTYNVICLNDSGGTVRWRDTVTAPRGVVVTDDDRVFVCTQKQLP